ncbi:UNVERIFIED_CONTAM: hypothetical protein GTU68_002681 [Idotea baltica]|nr:hypothetical protein [Idotea baltica]
MAELHLARDTVLDRSVAVKILLPQYASSAAFVERFRREAQSAGRLSHPNIAAVYDWGPYGETYYIAMEFVEGQTLADLLRENGPLLITEAGGIADEVANALDLAHSRGVIHRDIKPSNIMITPSGHAKVTDFGIAQALGADNGLTEEGHVMGTAAYISPEQALGRRAELQSDLYSLGVVMFEMVTGQEPFTGSSPVAVAQQHVSEPPPLASTIRPSVSPDLDRIIDRLLEKDPTDRYTSAGELRSDLGRLGRGEPPLYAPPPARQVTTRSSSDIDPTGVMDSAQLPNGQARAASSVPRTAAMPASAVRNLSPAPRNVADRPDVENVHSRSGRGLPVVAMALVLIVLIAAIVALAQGFSRSTDGEPVLVPTVIGESEASATAAIVDAGLVPIVRFEPNEDIEPGIVFAQDPAAQTELAEGDEVTILVSASAETVEVPDVVNKTTAEAVDELQRLGFTVTTSDQAVDSVDVGRVVSQSIEAGSRRNERATLTLSISTGPGTVAVPDLATSPKPRLEKLLQDRGLRDRY